MRRAGFVADVRTALVGTVALTMLVAGCSQPAPHVRTAQPATPSTSATTRPSETSPATSSTSSAAASSTGRPDYAVGQCLKDFTVPVACSAEHDAEVTAIVPDTAPEDAARNARRTYACTDSALRYIDGPYGTVLLSTSLEVDEDPQFRRRFVCLVARAKSDDTGVETLTVSLKGAVKRDGFFAYRQCTATLPHLESSLKFVPCDQPHVAESVWGFVHGPFTKNFPGRDSLNTTALSMCRPYAERYMGTAGRRDVVASQNSAPEDTWNRGLHTTGCFVQTDGTKVTGTLRGIGSKPLASLR